MLTREQVIQTIGETGVVLVVRSDRPDRILDGVAAVVDAGIRCVEITFTVKDAPKVIADAAERFGDRIALGAGTVLTVEQVDAAVDAGARYIISPGTDPAVIRRTRDRGAVSCPGVFTPTEAGTALASGADALKLFPAGTAGIAHLKALKGPFPGARWIPTGGIGAENLSEWLKAGVFAIGAGGNLFPPALVDAGKWDELRAGAQTFMDAFKTARISIKK